MQQQPQPPPGYQQQWNAGALQGGAIDVKEEKLITKSKFESYLSNTAHTNHYAILTNMDDEDVTVATSNRSQNHEVANKAARPI